MADRDSLGHFYKGMQGAHRSHGMRNTRFYRIYAGIKDRTTSKNPVHWRKYGGRGIKCHWMSFENFRDDMYESYLKHVELHGEKNTSIDRMNNDGNYEPGNCRWATPLEQARNTRQNKLITFAGKTQTFGAWADELRFSRSALLKRLRKFDLETAFTKKRYEHS